jgi:DNA-directed RNA polymerase subunit beta
LPVERITFSQIRDPVEIPNLLDVQRKSYAEFFQHEELPQKRMEEGLEYVFRNTFPIYDFNNDSYIEFADYSVGLPKFTIGECKVKGLTYAVPLRARFRLVVREREAEDAEPKVKDILEEELYLGEVPMMSERGSFIINGAERVVVNQLHRSPGYVTKEIAHSSGQVLYSASVIPHRGSWLEIAFDTNGNLNFSVDRTSRRPKMPVTVLLRAFGYGDAREIADLYLDTEELRPSKDQVVGRYLAEPVVVTDDGIETTLFKRFTQLEEPHLGLLEDNDVKVIKVFKDRDNIEASSIVPTLRKDDESRVKTREDALIRIYNDLRPGDLSSIETAENYFENIFFNPRRYDLSRVGRLKLNKCFGLDFDLEDRTLHKEDVVEAIRRILILHTTEGATDDIDHLGNRRVRAVGELLEYRFFVGLTRMERVIRERMSILDIDECMPRDLVNAKPLMSAVREFFGSSQLSQFLDQINPLAELTHKRKLSAVGPGGLSRERVNFEVRDVHYTHYGRLCPIETPEGPNIGLLNSLATYGRVNRFGFIETPYRRVEKGRVTDDIVYLDADEEDKYVIAQANAPLDEKGRFVREDVYVREKGEFFLAPPERIDYMDISPRQLVSISASLIPFLEHDDANRALMGSNMQRQAVPLVNTETPLVATGTEERVARDSGVLMVAQASGRVEKVTANEIVIRPDTAKEDAAYGWFEPDVYKLKKYQRTNQDTAFNQRPIVKTGDKVKADQIIADGPATCDGELALGRNVLVAFMPWMGYNFEDAVLVSRRLAENDNFTSIHIEEFEIECRETKLGREEITRDIPNVGSDALKNLDENGIIRMGAEVRAGDIMVGKVVPKGETELTPEEKLLRAIFGEKAGEVRDASLKAPPGMNGIVVDVKIFSRKEREKVDSRTRASETRAINTLENEKTEKIEAAREICEAQLTKLLSGQAFTYDLVDELSNEVLTKKNSKVTKSKLKNLLEATIEKRVKYRGVIGRNVAKVVGRYVDYAHETSSNIDKEIDRIRKGDDLPPGVLMMVKVYVARKRRLTIGDKMAGRHGNKGVVAKILPTEDMPFMEDGTPVDIVLNPLGVPSRLNVGQILETHLGLAAEKMGLYFESPIFDGATEEQIKDYLEEAGYDRSGKVTLFDGRTGETFSAPITVGYIYLMKLLHLADDKIHARSVGPYSLVTQQPLGGKGQFGGQRFGEMEVWALEAYGAAYTLQEMLTVKSDDVIGRARMYEAIVKGKNIPEAETPESFNVLVRELRALCLDITPEEG